MPSRDPAQGVINWFAAVMVCVALFILASAGLVAWGLWALVQHIAGA